MPVQVCTTYNIMSGCFSPTKLFLNGGLSALIRRRCVVATYQRRGDVCIDAPVVVLRSTVVGNTQNISATRPVVYWILWTCIQQPQKSHHIILMVLGCHHGPTRRLSTQRKRVDTSRPVEPGIHLLRNTRGGDIHVLRGTLATATRCTILYTDPH